MHIFNPPKQANYTTVPNALIRNAELSAEARGVLIYLLSHSETFQMSNGELAKHFKFGRAKVMRLSKQLQEAGYVKLQPIRNSATGSFVGWDWSIYSEPVADSTEVPKTSTSAEVTVSGSSAEPKFGEQALVIEQPLRAEELFKREETFVAAATGTQQGTPSVTGKNTKTSPVKKLRKDQFEADTESNNISKFLFEFCQFVETSEDRARISDDVKIGVRAEARRLIDLGITIEDLHKFKSWYATTFSGGKREAGSVLGYSFVRNKWAAFKKVLIQKPDGTTSLPVKTSDSLHEARFTPDGQYVEMVNKATTRVTRTFTLDAYQKAFPAGGAQL